jgi:hypothetical protein
VATRFYFPADEAAAVSPGFENVSWDVSGEAVRRRLSHVKGSSSVAVGTRIDGNFPSIAVLDRQYVSDPLAAQTISGTAKCFLQARESTEDDEVLDVYLAAYVVSNDGGTVRGTLLALGSHGSSTELVAAPSSPRAKEVVSPLTALSSVEAQAGDRLVVEIGYWGSGADAFAGEANWGENAADCPENETETASRAGWFELSADLVFQGSAGVRRLLLGVG